MTIYACDRSHRKLEFLFKKRYCFYALFPSTLGIESDGVNPPVCNVIIQGMAVMFLLVFLQRPHHPLFLFCKKKQPDLKRPYKVWGYPWVLGLFIVFSFAVMVNTFFESLTQSLMGIGLTLLGLPIYYYWHKKLK